MRQKLILLPALISLLAVAALVGPAPTADASPVARTTLHRDGAIHVNFAAVQAAVDDLRSTRSWLVQNKNRSAWRSRAATVDNELVNIGGAWSGSAASAIQSARQRFSSDVYAVPPRFDDGLAVLKQVIDSTQAAINQYTGGGGGGCQFCP